MIKLAIVKRIKLNNMLKSILSICTFFIFTACNSNHENAHNSEDHDSHHGHSNHHMNKTPFEDLVKNFESTDREVWQQPLKVIDFLGDLKNKTPIFIEVLNLI